MTESMTPHRQLLAEYARNGSEEAFRELVTAYIGMVHGSAMRLVNGNQPLAQDITQTVFTDLARLARTVSTEATIGGWLHRRTCHAAATAVRGEQRRLVRETKALAMNALNPDQPNEFLATLGPLLDEALNRLNEADRRAIMLRFFEQTNLRTVGDALGVSEDGAQKRVQRALEKLRHLLGKRGVILPAAGLALVIGSASATAAPSGLAAAISTSALAAASAAPASTLTILKYLAMTKLKATLIGAAIAVIAVGAVTTTVALHGSTYSYVPPANPNPQKILYEAQADTAAGRYQEAEAKFEWYRDNALHYQPSLVGVRNSFAIMYWGELAQKYPPARRKLVSIRDAAVNNIRFPVNPASRRSDFILILSINDDLHESAKTIELFKWLDISDPALARDMYELMEMPLIDAHEYSLCNKYMEADASYGRILESYRSIREMKKNVSNPVLQAWVETNFKNQCATIVAVLTINKHPHDASRIADEALNELNTPDFQIRLADARRGIIPAK
jgi:RNA polymerase sigma factor (sigma-70 family)